MSKGLHVLVGYASRFGSTPEIAERIATVVRDEGNAVDVRSADEVMSFDSYDGVVFGSRRTGTVKLHPGRMAFATCVPTVLETAASTGRHRSGSWRKVLLVCGIVSSLLYGAMIGVIRFDGYSRLSQAPSELTAVGAPTRSLWTLLGALYTVLVTAFGCGVWASAGRNRKLRIVGGLLVAYGSLGLLWPFAPMHQRDVLAAGGGTLSDTMHVALASATVLLMFIAMGVAATAFGKRFRLYSIASVVVLVAFGALTFWDAPRVQANLPTPWMGLWERINITVFLLWVTVLATVMLRNGDQGKLPTTGVVLTETRPTGAPRR